MFRRIACSALLVVVVALPAVAGAEELPPDDSAIPDPRAAYSAQAAPLPAPPSENAFPIQGRTRSSCSDSFGDARANGRTHKGVDCFAPTGTPLVATESGVIVSARSPQTYDCSKPESAQPADSKSGNNLRVLGDSGWSYYYGHLTALHVTPGQRVVRGQVVGTLGATGNAACSTPHLHFELNKGSAASVDPYPYMATWGAVATPPAPPAPQPISAPSEGLRLRNGGFERGHAEWHASGNGNFVPYATGGSHTGSWFGAFNGSPGYSIYQDLGVATVAGDSYRFGAWMRSQEASATGLMCLWAIGNGVDNNGCANYQLTSTWQYVEVVVQSTSSRSGLRAQWYPSAGTTWVDDASVSKNLISNGGFESAGANWSVGGGTGNFVPYSTVGHSGAGLGAFNGSSGYSVYQDVSIASVNGESFRLGAWMRSQDPGGATGTMCLYAMYLDGNGCTHYQLTTTWQYVEAVVHVTGPRSGLRAQWYPGGGTTWLDTVSLSKDLLRNPGLEVGGGWQAPGNGTNGWFVVYGNGGHTGSNYGAFNGNEAMSVYQDLGIATAAGDAHRFGAWLRSQDTGNATGYLCLYALGPGVDSSGCTAYSVSTTWTYVEVILESTANRAQLRAQLYSRSGTTWFDTTSLR